MSRPRLGAEPMMAAERMRRHRERKRHSLPEPEDELEAVRRLPLRLRAKYIGRSERALYYMRAFMRNAEIKWDDDVVNGSQPRQHAVPVGGLPARRRRGAAGDP